MTNYKSGFVAVIGRPNVGKSTLMNELVGQKIAIMSPVAQTTRTKIRAIYTDEEAQIIFVDTPGLHKPLDKLGEYMVKAAEESLKETDAVYFVTDATADFGAGERYILERLKNVAAPVILVINKIDLIGDGTKPEAMLPIIKKYADKREFAAVVPVSAKNDLNTAKLIAETKKLLPQGVKYYPDDYITDQPERLIVAEIIREKALLLTRDEVPHAIAVETEEMKKRGKKFYIRAVIYVEHESQKGIVIGKKGSLLKEIGAAARLDAKMLVGCDVYLDLWVKVKKDWRKKDGAIKNLGLS